MPRRQQPAPEVGQVVARRVEQLRRSQGLTQAELAKRLTTLGYPFNRVTVAKIENGGTRSTNIPLRDVMALSVGLSVAPLHLFVPVEEKARVKLTEKIEVSAVSARMWVRGEIPLVDQNDMTYYSEVPRAEWSRVARGSIDELRRFLDNASAAAGSGDTASYANALRDLALGAEWQLKKGDS